MVTHSQNEFIWSRFKDLFVECIGETVDFISVKSDKIIEGVTIAGYATCLHYRGGEMCKGSYAPRMSR